MWVLTLILLHLDGASVTKIDGFASRAECLRAGSAWVATVNHKDEQPDTPIVRCAFEKV